MGGSSVKFQTPTPLYSSIAGQPGYGTLFPAAGLGWPGTSNTGPGSPFYRAIEGINNLSSYGSTALQPAGQSAIAAGTNINNTLSPFIGQALQQGFDPQSALFNKLFQQQQDQSNAENAMAGVATTPYGAALTQQGNQNFDLAWQQQQLANQAQGASTAEGLAGAGLGSLTSGINTAASLSQQQIQDYLNYIMSNVGEGSAIVNATNGATNAGANSTNSLVNAQNASNAGKSGIGSALGGIGSLVGSFL